ncbi:(2Fe-2S)-binding protein [Mesorhizobium sp.]|uniref:(2Fe-2S)-binding protein n=1 Tax=Mesorhizobium sp. TaxID=1871066 RepID=UPI00257CA5D0|nr:(2Fe-2S)-binding protein [Mesorhizobium sp.]
MARLIINGTPRDIEVDPDTPLLWVIREQIGLTGTKYGCGVAACGACTIHIDGVATRSCVLPVSAVEPDQQITTIEGLSPDGSHPVQQAWLALDVPQCGYCQAGMIMAAAGEGNCGVHDCSPQPRCVASPALAASLIAARTRL